ncbi:hypothetical protein EG327_010475 [Venturia inaequalis]|uniref:Major facilitator superfamily (MFS) profile domain-containing protein n=1 Tax=Venturia inaequalis TaxID=5025 RepID=A0A8H3UGM7_VENIN|nr:hypothetical protein EG327_010475 [Venturia inaequalis]
MDSKARPVPPTTRKWSCGVLDSTEPTEVPGTVLLYPEYASGPTTALEGQEEIDRSDVKKTPDGVVLSPQPEETLNDPLNFPLWRRNAALMALGLYCMLGGGGAPLIAIGFPNVAATFHVTVPKVALTTGLYMMGLGLGSVFLMPTAIIFGKRPVYLLTAICFIGISIWCALSPSYNSLLIARIAQGMAISPVECLASSTVSELFFLHERAFRLGIYTLLLLSGKNLLPLMSAEIIQVSNWRMVFWVVAGIAAFCLVLMAFFLPETFWDRTSVPSATWDAVSVKDYSPTTMIEKAEIQDSKQEQTTGSSPLTASKSLDAIDPLQRIQTLESTGPLSPKEEKQSPKAPTDASKSKSTIEHQEILGNTSLSTTSLPEKIKNSYTDHWRHQPPKSFTKSLTIFPGRLSTKPYHLILIRPFILFAYPSIAWASLTYACSVGWLIVLSESISALYRNRETYDFTALETGLVYLSAFVGAVFGTAVAGVASDFVVRFLSKRNGGVYEPEFRLVMMVPVAISSVAGLMGFGWSIELRDMYMVPTVFFGLISFGCSLGSTVAISFAVDCYREFAGEALVTLNFSKNILHGLVWSLFFPSWLEHKGSKNVYVEQSLLMSLPVELLLLISDFQEPNDEAAFTLSYAHSPYSRIATRLSFCDVQSILKAVTLGETDSFDRLSKSNPWLNSSSWKYGRSTYLIKQDEKALIHNGELYIYTCSRRWSLCSAEDFRDKRHRPFSFLDISVCRHQLLDIHEKAIKTLIRASIPDISNDTLEFFYPQYQPLVSATFGCFRCPIECRFTIFNHGPDSGVELALEVAHVLGSASSLHDPEWASRGAPECQRYSFDERSMLPIASMYQPSRFPFNRHGPRLPGWDRAFPHILKEPGRALDLFCKDGVPNAFDPDALKEARGQGGAVGRQAVGCCSRWKGEGTLEGEVVEGSRWRRLNGKWRNRRDAKSDGGADSELLLQRLIC